MSWLQLVRQMVFLHAVDSPCRFCFFRQPVLEITGSQTCATRHGKVFPEVDIRRERAEVGPIRRAWAYILKTLDSERTRSSGIMLLKRAGYVPDSDPVRGMRTLRGFTVLLPG